MNTLLVLLTLSAADLILKNGNVVTVDAAKPKAQAVAVANGRIAAVGSDAEVKKLQGPNTQVIDLGGATVVPGFIEGHGHFMMLGRAKTQLDLTRAKSWDEIVAQVAAAAKVAKKGEWIIGDGWHQEKWVKPLAVHVEGNPVHAELSKVSPDNPVRLMHASGHASFANAKAMELAGITRDTKPPHGGEILHDSRGNPTGLLRETAQTLLPDPEKGLQPSEKEALWRRYVELAGNEALAKGVTSFHDLGANFETIDFFKKLADEGRLPVRLYPMVRWETNEALARGLKSHRLVGYGNGFLTVRAIKRQIDGALGAHGAWLEQPYADLPGSTGLNLETPEDIAGTADLALQHGYQLAVHAIGDRANRETLDLYEKAFKKHPGKKDVRWRIEHAQHVAAADVPRFKKLNVIASMQGNHCTSDGPWVLKRLGHERAKAQSYLWRTFLDLGVPVTNGTDVPVEDIDPLGSFHAAVTRQMADGQPFFPEQKMTRDEALKSYTLANAYAAFEEGSKGSIVKGKLADLTVLSKDIMTVPEDELRQARVLYTLVGGKVAYRAEAPAN
jgi:predicted amidohydrolase YtcJ